MKETAEIKLIKINDDNESAVADILLEAFTEEGLSNYLFDFSNPQTRALFNSLGKLKLRLFTKGGHTAVAALVNGEIAGAALVHRPEKTPLLKAFAIYYSKALFLLPKS